MTVVMSSSGYPQKYKKNTLIENLNTINISKDNYIFHAGTKREGHQWLSNGGRVLAISSLGESIKQVKKNVYSTISKIKWQEGYYRKDIGWRYTQ
jgi:phosphoribosylamine--glycine ligase